MSFKINDAVTWVGKVDLDFGKVFGKKSSTTKGTTYNSFLIRDKKTVLIDSVWSFYGKEFVEELKKEIDLKEIDYIVATHGEIDHSGGLLDLMKEIPDTPIYCTCAAINSLKGHFHQDWDFVEVKSGDELDIGERKLVFMESKMLHWPDSMFVYMTKDNILFSTDVFGQNYAGDLLFDDCVEKEEIHHWALKTYANIFAPFSSIANNKIEELLSTNLTIDMICPSHGVIWRDDPSYIINKYAEWSNNHKEDQITILYDTMRGGTARMAQGIVEGIKVADNKTKVRICTPADMDNPDIALEIFRSKAVLIGSPTMNNGMFPSISGLIEMMRGMKLKNKKYAAFGCYGWSGESVKNITEELKRCKLEVVNDGIREMWNPNEDAMNRCVSFGKNFAEITRC